ncbi:MAG: hypothetical protein IPN72_25360 [Saprospiraceae bacterium]|nr:hypothetical protein [Saprospiraceae bacterium]
MEKQRVYNWPSAHISLDSEDIRLLSIKQHPMQAIVAAKFGVVDPDEYFGLPQKYMLAFDKTDLYFGEGSGKYGKGYATASYDVSMEDPWFWCHFIGDPVMPGSQGLDAFLQLAGLWAGASCELFGRARALEGNYTYNGQILPYSKKIFYRVDIIRFLKKKKVLFFEGHLAVDTPENIIYQFGSNKMGFFTKAELSIPDKPSGEYYQPDWELAKIKALEWIENARKYYEHK